MPDLGRTGTEPLGRADKTRRIKLRMSSMGGTTVVLSVHEEVPNREVAEDVLFHESEPGAFQLRE
jgi:hypothetical protein